MLEVTEQLVHKVRIVAYWSLTPKLRHFWLSHTSSTFHSQNIFRLRRSCNMFTPHTGDCVYTHYISVILSLSVAFSLITFWWGGVLWKMWSIMARLQLAAEAKWGVSCVSAELMPHTTYTNLCCPRDNNRQTTEISSYLPLIMCCGWINRKHYFLHLKVVNATDREMSVNRVLETLCISILFVNTILFWITVIFCKSGCGGHY